MLRRTPRRRCGWTVRFSSLSFCLISRGIPLLPLVAAATISASAAAAAAHLHKAGGRSSRVHAEWKTAGKEKEPLGLSTHRNQRPTPLITVLYYAVINRWISIIWNIVGRFKFDRFQLDSIAVIDRNFHWNESCNGCLYCSIVSKWDEFSILEFWWLLSFGPVRFDWFGIRYGAVSVRNWVNISVSEQFQSSFRSISEQNYLRIKWQRVEYLKKIKWSAFGRL